ncbi:MAG: tripartite tricarboxylate transporter TctB family protein [Thermodesulfobacteriota bacterium]
MAKKDLFSSLFFICLSVYVCWESIGLKFGTFSKPGSGFIPLLAGLVLGFLGLIIFFRALIAKPPRGTISKETSPWTYLVFTFCSMIGFVLFMDDLGFNLATFLFIGILLKIVEKKNWIISVVSAIGVTLGAYIVFDLLLKSQLPGGPFGF